MPDTKSAIRLLMVHDTQNDAEPLINLLRNAGKAVRSHFIASENELTTVLEGQTWDLFFLKLDTETVNGLEAIKLVEQSSQDLPIVGFTASYSQDLMDKAFKLGAKDVVVQANEKHMLHAGIREYESLKDRRFKRTAEVSLKESEKRCQLLLDSSIDAITYVHDGMHIYANQTYMELFGYDDMDELSCTPIMDLVKGDYIPQLKTCLKSYTDGSSAELKCEAVHENGDAFKAKMTFSGATYEGEHCTQVVIRRNDADNADLEEKIKEISAQDLVTSLFNRHHFNDLLDKAYSRAVEGEKAQQLIYLSLDKFAELKTTAGVAGTDLILKDVAEIITKNSDANMVNARYRDDVFTSLLTKSNPDQAKHVAANISKQIKEHLFEVNGKTVQLQSSIGICTIDQKQKDAHESLTNAHRANAQAIESDNKVQYFDKTDIKNLNDDSMAAQLRHALENNGFKILFQPVISLRGDTQEHYEVLLRLIDKDGKEVSPTKFLNAADVNDLTPKVDRWVVLQSIKVLAKHRQQGTNTQVFINITPETIQDPTFLPWVSSALKASRLPGDALCFQFTEEQAQSYLKAAKTFSKTLEMLKCRLSISNFGLLDSGFSITKHLSIDYLKVHRDYVQNLDSSEEVQKNLAKIVGEVHEHEIKSIVPHIDSANILATLWQAGVNYIQGYYFQAPAASMDYNFSEDDEDEAV